MTATSKPGVVAVLLAGGVGARMGGEVPKQLLRLAGREVLAHAIDVFEACPDVDEIRVFMAADHVEAARRLVTAYGYAKVRGVEAGGATRDASTRRALEALAGMPDDAKVLVHDAVRPLVDPPTVARCVAALDVDNAVTAAIPTVDTILEIAPGDAGEHLVGIPDRARLRRCQTPQGFRLATLAHAHALAAEDPAFAPTDDCGVVRRYLPDEPVAVVPGSEHNLKITHPGDLAFAEQLLRDRTL
ncbi:MAG: 2-C-methyl-D-erythritol 4-phosphate cytidylyltransferase [Stackebrandtia sp.]